MTLRVRVSSALSAGLRPDSIRRHWRGWTFAVVLVLYAVLSLCVVYKSPVLSLDAYLKGLDLRHRLPESWKKWISFYVAAGQRGPSTLIFLPFFIWTAWRMRSSRPLVMLATALLMLNFTVGVVKIFFGRLGPLRTHNTHAIFDGGNIYPSGHVSNTVVLYGLIAMVALEYSKWFAAAAVWLSVTVGAGTIYLNTHWFSDVVGGWLAGGLILLAMPWVMPFAQRCADAVTDRALAAWRGRRAARGSAGASPAGRPAAPGRPRRPVTARSASAGPLVLEPQPGSAVTVMGSATRSLQQVPGAARTARGLRAALPKSGVPASAAARRVAAHAAPRPKTVRPGAVHQHQ